MSFGEHMPTACFADTRLEALRTLQAYTRVIAIATVPGSRVHRHCLDTHEDHELIDRSKSDALFKFVSNPRVEIVFSAGCPLIFPQTVLENGARFINSHPALLPNYKGYSPIKEAFRNAEEFMGVTVHDMVAEADSGPTIWQEKVRVAGLDLEEIYALLLGIVEPLAITRALERVAPEFP